MCYGNANRVFQRFTLHLCVTSMLLSICDPDSSVLFSCVGIHCWRLPSSSRTAGAFGGKDLYWPRYLVVESPSSSSRCYTVYMLYKVYSYSNYYLLCELLSAFTIVRHTLAAVAAHPLEFEVSRCRISQFARYFLPTQGRMWNDLPYIVFRHQNVEWM